MPVIATAGHVDHGKSTLVLALTGTDPDRWAEEKARGLTIDLGFAVTTLPSGHEIAFVDVPGHSRFLKNMLAGVSTVDGCLFVVAATEGWKAQSEEHLRVLELLAIPRGVVAVTKIGSASDESRRRVTLDIHRRLEGSFLEDAELVEVDAPAGLGLDRLRQALTHMLSAVPEPSDLARPRLWIDRSFPVKGLGTVVTGTLAGGSLSVGQQVSVVPGSLPAKIRGMQSHHRPLSSSAPGRRLAVNLSGVDHDAIERGAALVEPGRWHETTVMDVALRVLDSCPAPVSSRGAYVAHIGTGHFPVRVRVIGDGREILPGAEGTARLWLGAAKPIPLLPGDRYVLRESGRGQTVGGGTIVDVDPVLPLAAATPYQSTDRVIAERRWVEFTELERLTGERRPPNVGRWVMDPSVLRSIRLGIAARIAAEPAGVAIAELSEVERAVAASGVDGVATHGARLIRSDVDVTRLGPEAEQLLHRLSQNPWSPPDPAPEDRPHLRELARRGLACEAGRVWFAQAAVESATEVVRTLLVAHPEGFTVSEARQSFATTRKFVLPLLALLDARGLTRRLGDVRVGGPRMVERPSAGSLGQP